MRPRTFALLGVVGATLGAPAAGAQRPATHLVIVAGAGGEAQYSEAFRAMAARLAEAAVRRLGLPAANVVLLAEDSTRPPASGRSSRATLERTLAALAQRAGAADRVVIVLIGHGSQQGDAARFNLPGRDVSAAELAPLLAAFGTRAVAVVNAASASGEWVKALAGPNRLVITATRSGNEGNATLFPRYFVDALAADGADADKDGAVSLYEAYDFARREVARAFEQDNRMPTEHAQLGDTALARRIAFHVGAGEATLSAAAAGDPALARLHATRDSLQGSIEALRGRKATMPSAAYDDALERLLVALATTNRSIRQREGKTP